MVVKRRNEKRLEVAERRARITRMFVEGMLQHEIARILFSEGVFPTLNAANVAVCQDLAMVRKGWRDTSLRDFDELRGRQFAKLERLEGELWLAWERSKRPGKEDKVERKKVRAGRLAPLEGESGDQVLLEEEMVPATEIETTLVAQRDGDPRFSSQILECIGEQSALMGLRVKPGDTSTAPPVVAFRVYAPPGANGEAKAETA